MIQVPSRGMGDEILNPPIYSGADPVGAWTDPASYGGYTPPPATPVTSGAGFNYGQLANLIAASTAGTASVLRATQPPYSLPGSNLVYNPATGQLSNPLGYTAGTVATSLTPLLMVGGLGLLLVVMLAMRKT